MVFSVETMQARRKWNECVERKSVERKKSQPSILCQANLSFIHGGAIKTSLDNKSWGSSWPLDMLCKKNVEQRSSR